MVNRPQVVPSDPEKALMWRIHGVYHSLLADVALHSAVPEAFLAALIANESAGRPEASRYEPHVMVALSDVVLARSKRYGSIGPSELLPYVDPAAALNAEPSKLVNFQAMLQRLADLATSWGLTQIMGYEAIAFRNTFGKNSPVQEQLSMTVKLLVQFAKGDALDLRNDFEQMFDCWNTGRPHALTADPKYIPNGLARMRIYSGLLNEEASS